jgi:OmpA-OmpF porin, OOP family
MKKKLLGLALLSAVSLSQAVAAQEFDDRWYLSGTVGVLGADDDRLDASNSELYGIGIGKRITPNFGLEFALDRASPTIDIDPVNGDVDWDLTSAFLNARYYFVKEGRTWDPYLVGGLGATRHDVANGVFKGTEWAAKIGAGLESDRRKRVDYRIEAGARWDSHEETIPVVGAERFVKIGGFMDFYAAASVLVKLGNLPVPVVAVAAPTCDTLDGDNDGVNDCNDKCPNSEAGQTIGADGCPVKLTIDLKGVNFDFDKATLRPDAVVILDEAVAVLAKYPELKVEVAGHTDLCGKDTYNQDLSQRRAQTVFDYLTGKGIDAGRLMGPTGYGESRPLEATEQSSPACKSETNRRTELNVQN